MYQFPPNLYSDIRIEDVASTTIIYDNGILKQNKASRKKGAFLRVYDGRRWYYCATTQLGNIQEELARLSQMASPDPKIADDPVVRRFQVNHDEAMRYTGNDLRKVSREDKKELLKTYLPVPASFPEITVSRARYVDTYEEKWFWSSLGAELHFDYQHCSIVAGYTINAGAQPFQNAFRMFEDDFSRLAGRQAQMEKEIQKDIDYAANASPVEPGNYTCILSPGTAGVFAHESFGHKSEADFMLGSETMMKEWAVGTRVGSDKLNIIDWGMPQGSGYVPYDDEGTRTCKTYLIKDGILSGRLHSASTAAALGEEVTGNARAISFEYEPIVRMTSTYIGGGSETFEELLAGAEGGIYIPDFRHGSGMSTFTIAPAKAYRIRDGKIAEPLLVSVISGNVMETLHKIDGVSKEATLFSNASGGCGKMEQFPLRVAYGGPYIRVRDIHVQ